MEQHASGLELRSVDVQSALQAFAAAVVLLGLSSTAGSLGPLLAAGALALYALIVPLRLLHVAAKRTFLTFIVRIGKIASLTTVAAAGSVFAVNFGNDAVAIAGNVGMLMTVMATGALIVWNGSLIIRRAIGIARRSTAAAFENWRTPLAVALLYLRTDTNKTVRDGASVKERRSVPTYSSQ
jgi:hypothetical protein